MSNGKVGFDPRRVVTIPEQRMAKHPIEWHKNEPSASEEPLHLRHEDVTLDPTDEFESVLIEMVRVQRTKRADYALDGDRWSNFRESGDAIGVTPLQAIDLLVGIKQARLKALRLNGRKPSNESVYDTYLDRAVYSVLALAYVRNLGA